MAAPESERGMATAKELEHIQELVERYSPATVISAEISDLTKAVYSLRVVLDEIDASARAMNKNISDMHKLMGKTYASR